MSALTPMHGIVVVRARDQVDVVRRRLQGLALTQATESPEVLSVVDTRLVLRGPEVELRTWRCALVLREQLLGEVDVRIACAVVAAEEATRGLPVHLRRLLASAPWNMVLALAPLHDGISVDELVDAREWILRDPPGARALAYPASDIQAGEDSIFDRESTPQVRRYVLRVDQEEEASGGSLRERDGFLDVEAALRQGAMPVIAALTRSRCTLIVAPPWTGKTYVAERTQFALRRAGKGFVQLTNLERPDERLEYTPSDWKKWRASSEEFIWLLDAVDEALHRGGSLRAIQQHLSDLTAEEKLRLRLVLFTRDDDTKERVTDFLRAEAELFGSLSLYRLLPIDRREALGCLATEGQDGEARLESTLARLRAARLDDWAIHVPMLIRAAELAPSLTPNQVRDALLERLCTDSSARLAKRGVPPSELLRIAGRIAAGMLLSQTVAIEEDGVAKLGAGVLLGSESDARAFCALTQTGPLLVRTAEGYRFRQEHAKELLAAHALSGGFRLSLLRRLMTDAHGRLRPELGELAQQLKRFRPEDASEIDAWSKREVPPCPPRKAILKLKRMEELAPRTWQGLYIRNHRRLQHPQIKEYLLARVKSAKVPPEAKKLFLDIAWHNKWSESAPVAVKLALAPTTTWELRAKAVDLLSDLGTSKDRERLRPLLDDTSDDSQDVRARLLLWAVKDGADPLDVARSMPLPERGFGDYRSVLQSMLEDSLRAEHARIVLDAARGASNALDAKLAEALAEAALDVLLRQGTLDAEDRSRLVWALIHRRSRTTEQEATLRERLSVDIDLRRALYLQFHADPKSRSLFWPPAEDTEWLFERLRAGEAPGSVVHDLLYFAPRTSAEFAAQVEDYVRAHYSSEYETWKQRRLARAEEEARHAELQAELDAADAERESKRAWIGDLIRQSIASEEQPLARLHQLAWLCFDRDHPSQVDGTFTALPPELKQRVFDHVKKLLNRAEPTPLPTQPGPYASAIRLEGLAFLAAVTWEDPTWLNAHLIRAWLPSVLFAVTREKAETLERCRRVDEDATAAAVVTALTAEVKVGDIPTYLHELPDPLWDRDVVLRTAHEIVESAETPPQYRALLLRTLTQQTWNRPATKRLVEKALKSKDRSLHVAGVRCLIERDPERALRYVDSSWSKNELGELFRPLSIFESGAQERAAKWPEGAVIAALRVLAPLELRRGQSGAVDAEYRLRHVRERLVERVVQMTEAAQFDEIVSELEQLNPEIGAYLRAAPATFEILNMFREPPASPPSLREVADALLEAREPRFRNENDFAEALLECIDLIGKESKEHIQLFSAGKEKPHESLIQTYVLTRLRDLLARCHPERLVFTLREPKQGPEVPDIVACAEGQGGKSLQVPIEIKWSHNRDAISALTNQLGERYVHRAHRPRGIYVVGFSGRPPNPHQQGLEHRLREAASEFKRSHPEATLDFRLLDARLSRRRKTDLARHKKRARATAKRP